MTETGRDAKRQQVRTLWRNRNFLLIVLCRGLMQTARQMLALAVGWDVYTRTGNVVDLGLIGLFMFIPILLLSIPAGLVADRIDRRVVVSGSLVTSFLAASAIGSWFHFDGPGVVPIFLLLLVGGSAHAFLVPALQSTMPKLVPRALFSNAVATSSSLVKIAQLAGPVGGGLLIAYGGQIVYAVIALMFLLAATSVAMIRANLKITEREPFSLSLLFGGFKYIWATPKIFAAISIDLIAALFGGILGILPAYAVDILGVGSEELGILRAAPAVGAFAIGMLLASRQLPWAVGRTFFVSLVVFAVSILLFSVSSNYWFSLGTLVLYGAADMVSVYVRQTLIQLDTPDNLRGRVGAVHNLSAGGSTQLGDFRVGLMAGLIGTPAAVAVGGLVTLAATAIWYRRFPELRRMVTF